MDIQKALLAKTIHDGDILTVVNARITPEFFTDDRYRRVFEYLLEHWRKYGTAPDIDVVNRAFPSYEWPKYGHTIDYFIDGIRQRRKHSILTEVLTEAITHLNDTHEPNADDNAITSLREGLLQVLTETAPTYDVDLTKMWSQLDETLEDRNLDPGYMRGITTGFHGINYVTGGFQPEQFIVMIGLPKAMKSSTLLAMAKAVHAAGKLPMVVGFEMSNEEQIDRLMSLYGQVSLTKVINGAYNEAERKRIIATIKALDSGPPFILSVDLASAMTVAGLQAKIMEARPDVLFIDGCYLMQSELPKVEPGSAQALTDIARGLKRLAQAQKIPIVVTTQATMTRSKGGLSMYSAMYTQAFGQSADLMLGVERVDPDAPEMGVVTTKLKVLASRAGPRAETILHWEWQAGRVTEQHNLPMSVAGGTPGDDDE